MCRMCEWLGEGQIWYLNPKNYAHRMYKKRSPGKEATRSMLTSAHELPATTEVKKSISDIIKDVAEARANGDVEKANRLASELNEREMERPGSQVLPLHDTFKIMDLVQGPIAAMMCICRKRTRGEEASNLQEYSCMGLGTGMLKWERWPERYRGGVEFLSPSQAKEWLEYWDTKGYVHIIMQEGQNFIGGLCNCDYPSCMPIRYRLDYGITAHLVKGEYVAKVDYERCAGCGECVGRCQFGALSFEVAIDRPNIDAFQCFGCGVCATACPRNAIELVPRKGVPALMDVW